MANSQDPCTTVPIDSIIHYETQLQNIATANGNNRASDSDGYQKSLDYIVSVLYSSGYEPKLQSFAYPSFVIIGEPRFSQLEPVQNEFEYEKDFRVAIGSGSGDLNARVFKVPQEGCSASDYSNFPVGAVALIIRGTCTFVDKVKLAATAQASGIIIYNNMENGGGLFSLNVQDAAVKIPVLSITFYLGNALTEQGSVRVAIKLETRIDRAVTTNIIADTPVGDPNSIIVVGSHLDSVTAGPGINDNGSGSSTNLELALQVSRCYDQLRHKIRFCWWGAEELGLLGSRFYVKELEKTPEELKKIILNLNFDMLGSPNYIYAIYDGRNAAPPIREKCALIQAAFEDHLTNKPTPVPFVSTPFNGRSDYGPFIEVGIPAGGLFTGAEGIKTVQEARIFGGIANAAYDVCYHQACDTTNNINKPALGVMSDAAYGVMVKLANDPFLKEKFYFDRNLTSSVSPHIYRTHPDAISLF